MTNSWALLYDELYGEDKMNEDSIQIGTGSTESFYSGYETVNFDLGNVNIDNVDLRLSLIHI